MTYYPNLTLLPKESYDPQTCNALFAWVQGYGKVIGITQAVYDQLPHWQKAYWYGKE